ncbi:ABC transporter ATP-binding protein [Halomonas daqingensis]|uniref:ABC transporter ATP-binding protein n=1 Tax=Billgrantia desiderata TaxID=52021 RepID=A0AAW4YRW7_9GAMM|nr:ABC transporter ATP-binding protein [Halomonas desiderata]MCE8014240.1 ABC transporter ATP-binding protein [Halomonas desiderata]MCE8050711.1 ABC transporter ATP-binding protein [Halomonas desiderata]
MSLMIVDNLGKAYRTYKTEWHRFGRWLGIPCQPNEEHWVLRHLSFEIQPGEAIGIVGQNGAGKSTLLKMITGTLQPTEGSIEVNGRIAAILELGMGFNGELSGRENVYHAAGLMGFSVQQIQDAMPNIEAFAEIGDYFDQPVRTYSSGMQMRVAFAVATAYRPEILIVDEALSVGDSYFQHKSFNRIREFQEQGTTLMIVSHDRSAIQSLCDRAILLEQGRILKDGNPEEVFDYYNAIIAEKEQSTIEVKQLDNGKIQTSSGTGEARVQDIALYNSKGEQTEYVAVGEAVQLRVKVKVFEDVEDLVLGYGIKDRVGQVIYGTNTWHSKQVVKNAKQGDIISFVLAFTANLGVGTYSVQTALVNSHTHMERNYEWRDISFVFDVVNVAKMHFAGCCWIEPTIAIEKQ